MGARKEEVFGARKHASADQFSSTEDRKKILSSYSLRPDQEGVIRCNVERKRFLRSVVQEDLITV